MMPASAPETVVEFHRYGAMHLAIICVTIGAPVTLGLVARNRRGGDIVTRVSGYALSSLLIVNWGAEYVYNYVTRNMSVKHALPMQLCDWAAFVVIVALLRRNRRLYEVAYFWGLSGTLQAILTPNLQVAFPDFRFISFFVGHCSIVAGVIFMTVAMRFRPVAGSLPRAWLWSQVYLAAALLVNRLVDGNYGFLSHKPNGASLLDILSTDKVTYILELDLLAIAFFVALYAPFAVYDLAKATREGLQGAAAR